MTARRPAGLFAGRIILLAPVPRPLLAVQRVIRPGETARLLTERIVPSDFGRRDEIRLPRECGVHLPGANLQPERFGRETKPFRRLFQCQHFIISYLHIDSLTDIP